ncbi:(Trans)glycosidase [Mycolicibacterium canariasense]|uniref:(Trans)glycosidase n=1 Tax=Mycolicibacterium canariasense TaxID=228230 RepID=A0A117ICL8_MYCCR|nr:(Trans)glycosidase [Mycolicibacterium canariasense]
MLATAFANRVRPSAAAATGAPMPVATAEVTVSTAMPTARRRKHAATLGTAIPFWQTFEKLRIITADSLSTFVTA